MKKPRGSTKPKFLSLFSGVGGLDLGFIEAGFDQIAAFDNCSVATTNYKRNISGLVTLMDLSLHDIDGGVFSTGSGGWFPMSGFFDYWKKMS